MIRSRPRWRRSIGSGAAMSGVHALARCAEDLLRLVAVAPAARLRLLRRLEVLVALEEVLDLVAKLVRDVVDVADPLEGRVPQRHREELLVRALLVLHVEDPDRAHTDPAAGER